MTDDRTDKLARRRCGCPEQSYGRWCPACHGTGQIPPLPHAAIEVLQGSKNIVCGGKHA